LIPLRQPEWIALLAVALLASGCASQEVTRLGDAKLSGNINFAGSFRLPKFSLGKAVSHRFQVRGLKSAAFPYKLRIYTRHWDRSYSGYTRWRNSLLKVEILAPGTGRRLASTTFHPNRYHNHGSGIYDHVFWSPGQPNLGLVENYDVRVTVLEPSPREWDEAQLLLR